MDDDERTDLIRKLFALATSKAESAAGFAVEGQAPDISSQRATELGGTLRDYGEELALLAEAVCAIASLFPDPPIVR